MHAETECHMLSASVVTRGRCVDGRIEQLLTCSSSTRDPRHSHTPLDSPFATMHLRPSISRFVPEGALALKADDDKHEALSKARAEVPTMRAVSR